MSEKRWWCDWYLSRSSEPYLQDDERFFSRLVLLVPSIGLLSSWPWWNNQSLFPWWFGTLSASILSIVIMVLLFHRERISFPINVFISVLLSCAMACHIYMLLIELAVDPKKACEIIGIGEGLFYLLCWWPNSLWWAVLRDGLYLIVVICSILSIQFSNTPSSFISEPFDDQLVDSPLILRRRREQRRRLRRSSFVIHYVLSRTGHIRRRRRRLFRN